MSAGNRARELASMKGDRVWLARSSLLSNANYLRRATRVQAWPAFEAPGELRVANYEFLVIVAYHFIRPRQFI